MRATACVEPFHCCCCQSLVTSSRSRAPHPQPHRFCVPHRPVRNACNNVLPQHKAYAMNLCVTCRNLNERHLAEASVAASRPAGADAFWPGGDAQHGLGAASAEKSYYYYAKKKTGVESNRYACWCPFVYVSQTRMKVKEEEDAVFCWVW